VTRGWARLLVWGSAGATMAAIPSARLIIAQPHPGRLGMEGSEGTPLVALGQTRSQQIGNRKEK